MRCLIIALLLATGLLIPMGPYLYAEDEPEVYPDEAGRQALRLWAERENDRAAAEAIRRSWDYWFLYCPPKYQCQDFWPGIHQNQRWQKDRKHPKPPYKPHKPSAHP